jgi:hypothetical protein
MQKTMEIERLPRSARRELFDFYDFLVHKYVATPKRASKITATESARRLRLQRIFDESRGKLPQGYKFGRDEAHER